jgi:hypothetical protein
MGNTNSTDNPIKPPTPPPEDDKSNQSTKTAITTTIVSKKSLLNISTQQTTLSRSLNTTPSNMLTLLNPFTLHITVPSSQNDQKQEIHSDIISSNKQIKNINNPKILMLHGWRTSGKILSMQSAALRNNISIDCTFIDAPFVAQGDPSVGIGLFYPNHKYYEWLYSQDTLDNLNNNCIKSIRNSGDVAEALLLLLEFIKFHGPFDGILGFSQVFNYL